MSEATEKKKRTLPEALAKHKFQKGHKKAKPGQSQTPAASSKPASAAANLGRKGKVIVRHETFWEWLTGRVETT